MFRSSGVEPAFELLPQAENFPHGSCLSWMCGLLQSERGTVSSNAGSAGPGTRSVRVLTTPPSLEGSARRSRFYARARPPPATMP
jgi:hypothetical protein